MTLRHIKPHRVPHPNAFLLTFRQEKNGGQSPHELEILLPSCPGQFKENRTRHRWKKWTTAGLLLQKYEPTPSERRSSRQPVWLLMTQWIPASLWILKFKCTVDTVASGLKEWGVHSKPTTCKWDLMVNLCCLRLRPCWAHGYKSRRSWVNYVQVWASLSVLLMVLL